MQTKFRLSVRWLCFAVLLAAAALRLAAQPGLRAHLASVAAPTQAAEDARSPRRTAAGRRCAMSRRRTTRRTCLP